MNFTKEQIEQLLKPINPKRVLKDGKGHSHVSQQDITAHLIRVFGFGSFNTEVLNIECVFEQERADAKGVANGRFDVCYRALLRLTVRDVDGFKVASYEDGSTATAQNQSRGDAHDLAYKSALSLSKKRAAINLGDQFGLSLYNKGQMTALVGASIAHGHDDGDVQKDVAQQVSLGNDEIDTEPANIDPAPFHAAVAGASDAGQLQVVGAQIATAQLEKADRNKLRGEYNARMSELQGAS